MIKLLSLMTYVLTSFILHYVFAFLKRFRFKLRQRSDSLRRLITWFVTVVVSCSDVRGHATDAHKEAGAGEAGWTADGEVAHPATESQSSRRQQTGLVRDVGRPRVRQQLLRTDDAIRGCRLLLQTECQRPYTPYARPRLLAGNCRRHRRRLHHYRFYAKHSIKTCIEKLHKITLKIWTTVVGLFENVSEGPFL